MVDAAPDFEETAPAGSPVASAGPAVDTPDFNETQPAEKYETLPQQALTAVEGAAQGIAGPLAPLVEKMVGVSPEGIRARQTANPWIHGLSEAAGLVGGLATGTGEAALLEGAGKAAAKVVTGAKAAEAITKARAAGALALRGAVEMAGYSGGDEISKAILEDPNQTAGSIVAHVGLSSLLGATGGAIFGAIKPSWAAQHADAVEQSLKDFQNGLNGTVADSEAEKPLEDIYKRVTSLKPNAASIVDAAERNQWPVAEGMLSGGKEIQQAEDTLLNGPPTIASVGRRNLYKSANDAVTNSVSNATQSAFTGSETELGNSLKESLGNKLKSEYQPIKDMYEAIEPFKQDVPIDNKTLSNVSDTIRGLIEDKSLVPGTERYNFVKTFADNLPNIDNLQKLSNLSTEVGRSAGPLTRDLASEIKINIDGLQDLAIEKYAPKVSKTNPELGAQLLGISENAKTAKTAYAAFRDKLQELGNVLGKKKIYGPQNFMDFLDDLNPQTLVRRSFTERNTEFAKYFSKEFPEEMQIIRGYQRSLLKDSATKEGVLNARSLINKVGDLEPETQKLLYAPDELSVVNDAKTYLDSFPKSFNPSGTSHETAFRAFFEHPTGAAIANARDYAILSFIKGAGRIDPSATSKTMAGRIIDILGPTAAKVETNAKAFYSAVKSIVSSSNGHILLRKAAHSLFLGSAPFLPEPSKDDVSALDDKLKEYKKDASGLFDVAGEMGNYLPNHAQEISKTAMNAVNYLNSQRPEPVRAGALSPPLPPTKAQEQSFQRNLAIAEQPLSILKHIKSGTLLPSDIQTLNTLYPGFYQKMRQEVMSAMVGHISKEKTVPYPLRQSLSLFLGETMDPTLSPDSIQAIQGMYAQRQQSSQPQAQGGSKKGTSKMGKLANSLQTPDQARTSRLTQA